MTTQKKYQKLLEACRDLPAMLTAVVHPCDEASLEAATGAAKLGLIQPILVGPEQRIRDAARQARVDIEPYAIVNAAHSHDSASKAVDLVLQGRAEALMKGSLHTDELMAAVVRRDNGLRTARRISHCFVMDVPAYEHTLIISDAAVNIAPTLEEKIDIVQNAIDLAHALQFPEVRVGEHFENIVERSDRPQQRRMPESPIVAKLLHLFERADQAVKLLQLLRFEVGDEVEVVQSAGMVQLPFHDGHVGKRRPGMLLHHCHTRVLIEGPPFGIFSDRNHDRVGFCPSLARRLQVLLHLLGEPRHIGGLFRQAMEIAGRNEMPPEPSSQ